jgi:hypothetical protein
MGIGKFNSGFPEGDPKNCCNVPRVPRYFSAANPGDRQRANPAIRLRKEAMLRERVPPVREISHVESNSV